MNLFLPSSPLTGTSRRNASVGSKAVRGFTLIELVVVIGLVGLMSAALIPLLIRPQAQARANETVRELKVLQEAILGNPELGDYGYVGNMGHLPFPDTDGLLTPLVEQELQIDPGFGGLLGTPHEDGWGGVALGWNGPYIRTVSASPLRDGWGQPYIIVTHATEPWRYRLRSGGPDRNPATTDDNIEFPSTTTWYSMAGQVMLHLQYMSSDGHWLTIPDYWLDYSGAVGPVQVRYPREGAHCELGGTDPLTRCEASCTVVGGHCLLEDVATNPFRMPFGVHVVRVVLDPATSLCTPGVSCEHYATIHVNQPVVNAAVRIPNPAPIGLPMSALGCTPVGSGTVSTGSLTLCTAATAAITVPVGDGEERVVSLQASGDWAPTASSSGCLLRLVHAFTPPLGGTTTTEHHLSRIRSGTANPPDATELYSLSGSFTRLLDQEGTHAFTFHVDADLGSGCFVRASDVSGLTFVQRP